MSKSVGYTLRLQSGLWQLSSPQLFGVVNATTDSFSVRCRHISQAEILSRAAGLVQSGAAVLDVGACSTRPNSVPKDADLEWEHLSIALDVIRSAFPKIPVSVDTFRAEVARKAIQRYQIDIVNDVSGGSEEMDALVAETHTPYILTYARACMREDILDDCMDFFSTRLDALHRAGVADVIIDPGFGFAKTDDQNFQLLKQLQVLQVFNCPMMVGVSRKSMIYKLLGVMPEQAVNGTTVLHTIALEKGAWLLRVHDVKEAAETTKLLNLIS